MEDKSKLTDGLANTLKGLTQMIEGVNDAVAKLKETIPPEHLSKFDEQLNHPDIKKMNEEHEKLKNQILNFGNNFKEK